MAATSQQPYEINDFTGGITDDFFDQDDIKLAAVLENYVVTHDKKLNMRPGSDIDVDTPADDQIPAGIQRVAALINYANSTKLFVQSGRQLFYRNPTAYATLQGTTGNDLYSTGNTSNAPSFSQWNKHIFLTSDAFPRPMKVYRDNGGNYQLRNSSLPALASSPVATAGGVGTRDYEYAFHFDYSYMADNQTFEDLGPVTFVTLENSSDPSISANNITSIPTFTNGVTDNWDLANIKVFIYRSIDGGTTPYKIGEVTLGTTSFVDNFSDDTIQTTGIQLYTNDGTVDFDEAPESKFVHVVNNTGYYGYLKIGDETFPNTIRQSIPAVPGTGPLDFEAVVEDEITGIYSIKSIPLVFCKRHIYRLEQSFDRFGRGLINPIRISDTAGCVSQLSIVSAENFTFWAGNDGFYATDGYIVTKISDTFNNYYKNYIDNSTQTNHIYGTFDERNRTIFWAIQRDLSSADNDSTVFLDIRWGISPRSTFLNWSGNSFRPTALAYFNKILYRGDTRGYVFFHSEDLDSDPKVDTSKDAQDWSKETIMWDYTSINMDFGSTFFRKMPTRILLDANNRGNTSIQINAINDAGKVTRPLKLIRYRRDFTWGDPSFVWGNMDCVWNSTGLIEQWRRFPAGNLRLSYLQIQITNGFSIIDNSDTNGLATFNTSLKTITLDDISAVWPEFCDDYIITTEVDNYQRQFTIASRDSDSQITVLDPDNALPMGDLKWEIMGFKKGEPLYLVGYNVFWNNISQTQNTFETGQDGANS